MQRLAALPTRAIPAAPEIRVAVGAEQEREHPPVVPVGVDADPAHQGHRVGRPGHRVVELHGLARQHARVAAFDPVAKVHVARDHGLAQRALDLAPAGVHLKDREEHTRRGVGREGVAHVAVREHERGLERLTRKIQRGQLARHTASHHVGSVDAPPEVRAVGHVAVLTVPTLSGGRALLPLEVGVLDRLAVGAVVIEELVALGTEAALQILVALLEAAVGNRLGQRGEVLSSRRTVAAMCAHVTARAHDALRPQLGGEVGVGLERARVPSELGTHDR